MMKTTTMATTTATTTTTTEDATKAGLRALENTPPTEVYRTLKMAQDGSLTENDSPLVQPLVQTVPKDAGASSKLIVTVRPNGGTPTVEKVSATTEGSLSVLGSWAGRQSGDVIITLMFPDEPGKEVEWDFAGQGAPPIVLKVIVKRLST